MIYRAFILFVLLGIPSPSLGQSGSRYTIEMVKPQSTDVLTYESRSIKIFFAFGNHIVFKLTNKTDGPIEILRDQASFVDANSRAHRIVHEGVRYIERDKSLPPTVIPPGALITDAIIPSDYIELDKDDIEWKVRNLFDGGIHLYKNKTFSVFLPLRINNRVVNQNYVFQVKELGRTRNWKARP